MNKFLVPLVASAMLISFSSQAESRTDRELKRPKQVLLKKGLIKKLNEVPPTQTVKSSVNAGVKSVTTAAGNTINFTYGSLAVLGETGKSTVSHIIDAGACAQLSRHPGELGSCAIDMGRGVLAVVFEGAAVEAAGAVYYVNALTQDWGQAWDEAFRACSVEFGPLFGSPCKVVSLSLNTSGKIVGMTAYNVGKTALYTGANGSRLVGHAANIPASLLRLQPAETVHSIFGTIGSAVCMGIDLAWIAPRLVAGLFGKDIGSVCE